MRQAELGEDFLHSSFLLLNGHPLRKTKSSGEEECFTDGGGRGMHIGLREEKRGRRSVG